MSTQVLRNMIRQSDLDGLEKVVLDGHGGKLIGENASDSKIRTFIKAVPSYLVIISYLILLRYFHVTYKFDCRLMHSD